VPGARAVRAGRARGAPSVVAAPASRARPRRQGAAGVTRALAAALALGAAAGCAVGPNYKRPTTPVTPSFRGEARVEAASFADLPWWEVVSDPALTALIKEALQGSYQIQTAVARVEVARQNASAATDALLPAVGVQAVPSYQQVFIGALSGVAGVPG